MVPWRGGPRRGGSGSCGARWKARKGGPPAGRQRSQGAGPGRSAGGFRRPQRHRLSGRAPCPGGGALTVSTWAGSGVLSGWIPAPVLERRPEPAY